MTRLIQITAYLRNEEDLAKWKALGNKTEWLHSMLNDSYRGQPISDMYDSMKPQNGLGEIVEPTYTDNEDTA